jgi:lysophospholipase L1-like esterase
MLALIKHKVLRALFFSTLMFSSQYFMHAQNRNNAWRATWAASPSQWTASVPVPPSWKTLSWSSLADSDAEQTIRDIVHVSAGGNRCRVRISNAFGETPLLIHDVHAAIHATGATGSTIVAATDRAVTFGGESSLSIPPGADMLSDPIPLEISPNTNLSVSLATTGRKSSYTIHFLALQTSYAAPGNQAGASSLHDASAIPSWPFLTEVQVAGHGSIAGTVVAFGDSITDGAATAPETNRRWPNRLFERIEARGLGLAVTDAGISGNRLLHNGQGNMGSVFGVNALARFDRDVLGQAGVRYLIVLLGINDIGQPGAGGVPTNSAVSAKEMELALSQLADRAHEHGIRVMGGTLLPFGSATAPGYYSADKEKQREEVNAWIRASGKFDAIADFDKALQDPGDATRMRAAFDGGDHLHPNDAGAKALADAIPLTFFSAAAPRK